MTSHSDEPGSAFQTDPFSICMVNFGAFAPDLMRRNIEALSMDMRQAGQSVTWAGDATIAQILEGPCDKILVFVPPLDHSVAVLIASGMAPSQALDACLSQCDDLLKLYRQNRRRISLIGSDGFGDEDRLLRAISEHLGVGDMIPRSTYESLPQPDALHMTLAAYSVVSSGAAGKIKGELDASSLAVGAELGGVDTDAAFAALQDLHAEAETARNVARDDTKGKIAQLETKLSAAQASVESQKAAVNDAMRKAKERAHQVKELSGIKDLLSGQLKTVQEELEVQFTTATHQTQQRQTLEIDLAALSKKQTLAQSELDELRAHDARQGQRLDDSKAQLDAALSQLEEKDRHLAEMQALLDTRMRDLEAFKESTSWKLTKPLRQIKDTMKPGKP